MTSETKVLNFIETIRNSFDLSVEVYTKGSCYKFYEILKCCFPESICYYNCDHAITKIGDNFYDITGKVNKTNHIPIEEDYLVHNRAKKLKYGY